LYYYYKTYKDIAETKLMTIWLWI